MHIDDLQKILITDFQNWKNSIGTNNLQCSEISRIRTTISRTPNNCQYRSGPKFPTDFTERKERKQIENR